MDDEVDGDADDEVQFEFDVTDEEDELLLDLLLFVAFEMAVDLEAFELATGKGKDIELDNKG